MCSVIYACIYVCVAQYIHVYIYIYRYPIENTWEAFSNRSKIVNCLIARVNNDYTGVHARGVEYTQKMVHIYIIMYMYVSICVNMCMYMYMCAG